MSYQDLQGWFNFEELYARAVAEALPRDTLVEVGVFMGKSLAYLSRLALDSGKGLYVVGVDSFGQVDNHLERFGAETARHAPDEIRATTILNMRSLEAAKRFPDRSLRFVWLDASHLYEDVRDDIQAWRPKIMSGGILAGHDYDAIQPGVIRAVDELIPAFEHCGRNKDCWWSVVP